MTSLKPCPFCGAAPEVEELYADAYVLCPNCHARTGIEQTEDLAIAAWNSRTDNSHAMQEEMLSMLLELQECSEYWSEYYVPIGLVDRLNQVIAKARGEE